MAEPLFGTAPPIWSAVPFPGPAWFQTPVAGGRPIAEGIVSPQGFAAGLQGAIIGQQGQGALGNGMVSGRSRASAPGQDMAGGVTATALVLAVALRRGQPAGPSERSGNRGLPLRRARSPAWLERRGGIGATEAERR